MSFQARRCASCGLRFPTPAGSELGAQCPACGAPTRAVDPPYSTSPARCPADGSAGLVLEALFDNIRSVRNVGSMFRTADGAGLRRLHLAGVTPTPENKRLQKTSLGAEHMVPWTRHADAVAAATELSAHARLWALEAGETACSLFDAAAEADDSGARPLVLVLGHEVSGIDPRVAELCEQVVEIPMAGGKGSLNVSVAFGVACYVLRHAAQLRRLAQP